MTVVTRRAGYELGAFHPSGDFALRREQRVGSLSISKSGP